MMTMPYDSGVSVVRGRHGVYGVSLCAGRHGVYGFSRWAGRHGGLPLRLAVSVTRAAGSLNFKLFTSRFARWSAPTAQRLNV